MDQALTDRPPAPAQAAPPDPAARAAAILAAFHTALDGPTAFTLAYQPRLDIRTARWTATEALLRWTDPVLGPLSPAEFIPLLEHHRLIRPLTRWVVRRALADHVAWTALGHTLAVSINLSAQDLDDPAFPRWLIEAAARAGADPAQVELEITETARLQEDGPAAATLARLAQAGFGIAIDDFGAGYSNLLALRDVPARILKLDRGLSRSLDTNQRDRVIVRSVIGMAHALGLIVVAEGVETAPILGLLTEWGCDQAQGWHIARPMPLDRLLALAPH